MHPYFKNNTINTELVYKHLKKFKSVTEKLNALEEISIEISTQSETNFTLHSLFEITKDTLFKNDLNNPELTFWFLKFNANKMLQETLNSNNFKQKIQSNRAIIRLESILNDITLQEQKFESLLKEGKIDDLKPYHKTGFLHFGVNLHDTDHIAAIEYLRVTDNYYLDNTTYYSYNVIKSPEVKAYYKHNLFKPHLIDTIKKLRESESRNQTESTEKSKKISAKFYALYHHVLIEMGIEKNFDTNRDGNFYKEEIISFASKRYNKTSSQGFYRSFIDLDISNKTLIAKSFGKKYKSRLIEISGNDANIINHLKKYPN